MPYTVQIENATPQLIAATKITTTRKEIGNDIGQSFRRLSGALRAASIESSGPPFVVYYDLIDDETDGDIEACIPINRKLSIESEVYSRELEGGEVVTTTHTGPYHELAPVYATLREWIAEHGHEIAGPPREIYLNDPQIVGPDELLTRVEFPIRVLAG